VAVVNKRIAKKIEAACALDMRSVEATRYWRAYDFRQRMEAFRKDTVRMTRKAAAVRAKRGWGKPLAFQVQAGEKLSAGDLVYMDASGRVFRAAGRCE
jgi:hypothetical protein